MIFTACEPGGIDEENGGNPTEQPGGGNGGSNGGGNATDPNNPLNNKKCASNEILYISKSCLPMELNNYGGWGAKLISNTYENGVGRLKFDATVSFIPRSAFEDNDLLEYIKLPNTIIEISNEAFYDCNSLESITIPNSVTSIGEDAFHYCSSLTSVTIGNSVTSIGKRAFYYCYRLTSVTIPDSVTSIGYLTFADCSSLTSVTIGNSVTSIVYGAFYDCTSLTNITISDNCSVTSIGEDAFYGCTSLTDTYVNITDLAAYATGNNTYRFPGNKHLFVNGTEIADLVIPDSVTSIGERAFYNCISLTSVTIPDSVTSIGDYAFYSCFSLRRVDITDLSAWCKISFGGDYANPFRNGAYLFLNGSVLTNITIPSDITEIKAYAFSGYTLRTSVTIPDSVTSIGEMAFYNCRGELIINSKIVETNYTYDNYPGKTWLDGSDFTKLTIGNSVTSIGEYAFYKCSSMTSVTIGNSVTSIGKYAFSNCTSLTAFYGRFASSDNRCLIIDGVLHSFAPAGLTQYTIPDSVTSISSYAFRYCTSLTSVTIGNSVTSIGEDAFYWCESLTRVTIGNSVTSIGEDAFYWCESLTRVDISDLSAWCKIDFADPSANPLCHGAKLYLNNSEVAALTIPSDITEIKAYAFGYCTSLTSVTIGNSVTSIGEYAFYNCDSLTRVDITDLSAWCKISFDGSSANPLCKGAKLYLNGSELTDITIPSDITKIKDDAFYGCTSLTSVTIGNSVTSIGRSAFYNCTSLTSVTIGNSVTSIENYAFYDCTSLKEVYCKPTIPPTGGSNMFSYLTYDGGYKPIGCKIYVPRNSVSAYKAKQYWSDYKSYIVGYDF